MGAAQCQTYVLAFSFDINTSAVPLATVTVCDMIQKAQISSQCIHIIGTSIDSAIASALDYCV